LDEPVSMQHQHQRRIGLVRAMPVEVDEVAVGQPQAFAVALQLAAATRWPQGLQVGIARPKAGEWRWGWACWALMMCLPLARNSATVPAPLVG
jgi:hypothetical protein